MVAPLSYRRGPERPGTHRWSSHDSWILFHGIASEEVTVRLVSPAHWHIMTNSYTH